jgi:arylsulfatase A-like enzyme
VLEPVDPEGGPVDLAWSWTVAGAPTDLDGPVVPARLLHRGQVWTVTAVPDDGVQDGAAATATATIGDAPPVFVGGLVPTTPRTGDVVACLGHWEDVDGDVVDDLGIAWEVDGSDAGSGPVLPISGLFRGQLVRCTASASEGEATTVVRVGDALVGDGEPRLATLEVVPSRPAPGGLATCRVGGLFDPEDDRVDVDVRWTLDGAPLGTGASVVVPEVPGGRLACAAVPRDSVGPGDEVTAWAEIGEPDPPGDVLVLLLDDIGVDGVGVYGVGTPAPPTPNLDTLAAEGVRFDRAWSHPTCSPTRAALLTGRYAFHTGYGHPSERSETWSLPDDATTVPEALATWSPALYATAAVGKWHVGTIVDDMGQQPLRAGFGAYHGVLGNLQPSHALDGARSSYTDYEYADGTSLQRRTDYLTVVEADDAIDAMATLPEPWFLYVAFHAVHAPWAFPPDGLWGGVPTPGVTDVMARADAMTEALDRQIGRILAEVPPDTTVIVLGDNGSPHLVNRGPYQDQAGKSTVLEAGVRVPLIVAGPAVAVPGSRSDALVSVTDVFVTALELAGADAGELPDDVGGDSVSLLPYLRDPSRASLRRVAFTEGFTPNGFAPHRTDDRAVRDDTWKLVRTTDGHEQLFRLGTDVIEGDDRLAEPDAEAVLARNRLAAWLQGSAFR